VSGEDGGPTPRRVGFLKAPDQDVMSEYRGYQIKLNEIGRFEVFRMSRKQEADFACDAGRRRMDRRPVLVLGHELTLRMLTVSQCRRRGAWRG